MAIALPLALSCHKHGLGFRVKGLGFRASPDAELARSLGLLALCPDYKINTVKVKAFDLALALCPKSKHVNF